MSKQKHQIKLKNFIVLFSYPPYSATENNSILDKIKNDDHLFKALAGSYAKLNKKINEGKSCKGVALDKGVTTGKSV